MAENLLEAAVLTVTGMLVVFTALVILLVVLIVLTRLTSRKGAETEEAEVSVSVAGEDTKPSKESIAVMAAGLAWALEKAGTAAGKEKIELLIPPTVSSPWVKAGREELMRSRGKVGHQWGKRSR